MTFLQAWATPVVSLVSWHPVSVDSVSEGQARFSAMQYAYYRDTAAIFKGPISNPSPYFPHNPFFIVPYPVSLRGISTSVAVICPMASSFYFFGKNK
jgi:hypothetical protein